MKIPMYQLQLTEDYKFNLCKLSEDDIEGQYTVNDPEHLVNYFKTKFNIDSLAVEEMYVVFVGVSLTLRGIIRLAVGSLNCAYFNKQDIFRCAYMLDATGIIIVHNHPTGDTKPSMEDINVTRSLLDGCKLLGLALLDHIIIGKGFTSFKQERIIDLGV